ncbi:MAG: DHH family phosphoesterase [Planctomycetota bacterium]
MDSTDSNHSQGAPPPPDPGRLGEVLDGHDNVLVFCHLNPDPDSIASALAMTQLLETRFGKQVTMCYRGIVGRAQNREMVSRLAPNLVPFRDVESLDFSAAILVDAQPEFGFNPEDLLELEQEIPVLVCIDHHPFVKSTMEVPFCDVRPGYGATATVMTEYLRLYSVVPTAVVATALYYGIKTDTLSLTRRTSDEDREAFAYLKDMVDHNALEKIEAPPLSRLYFRNLRNAIDHAKIYGNFVSSHLDELPYPDLVAEIADLMLKVEDSTWSVCTGRFEDTMMISVRTRDVDGDAGVFIRKVVGRLGQAGGHNTMAAARIPLEGQGAEKYAELRIEILKRMLTFLKASRIPGEALISSI